MDVSSFQTFLAAADTGSFARAADRVNARPSTVTERIRQLEHRLGARLFKRNKRGCTLTPSGEKFMRPARQAVRAWEVARHEVGLPDRFTRSISFGGQYVLWNGLLDWLDQVREKHSDLALRVTAGASQRLNRDLAEGSLDMVVLYDPVFRADVAAEPLFADRLVLVTGGEPDEWREDYTPIEWGRTIGTQIAARIGLAPETGLVLDLGERSAAWLTRNGKSGFMPHRAVSGKLASGELTLVTDAPSFDYPIYACWRRDADTQSCEDLLEALHSTFG